MNADLLAFGQVVAIDLVLAGDNAVVIGALAANLPAEQRKQAVFIGIACAVVARIVLSLGVVWLLKVPGVMIFGGLLLFWVAWKMWRDLHGADEGGANHGTPAQALHKAVVAIVLADLSMSLDNVLGVAGAAQSHVGALILGLLLSVILMGVGASLIAKVINRHRWIAHLGLALILFVAGRMSWEGVEVLHHDLTKTTASQPYEPVE